VTVATSFEHQDDDNLAGRCQQSNDLVHYDPAPQNQHPFQTMPSLSLFLSVTGVVLMLHSAYSCMHYRSLLQDMDLLQDNNNNKYPIPPMDVYVEVALSFVMILLGELLSMGKLQSVDVFSTSKRQPLMAPPYRSRDFDIYNNRSRVLLQKSS
jgi:Membrane magnesium transporter